MTLAMTTKEKKTSQKPCALALATAEAIQAEMPEETVILFGSRARGDHRPDSDIDLLILHDPEKPWAGAEARNLGSNYLKDQGKRGAVNAFGMTRERFHYARTASNHLAATVLKQGIIMSSERLNYEPDYPENEPRNWADIKERLQAAKDNLDTMNLIYDAPQFIQRTYGFHAQQAIENALKGWCSTLEISYDKIHDLTELAEPILNHKNEAGAEAGQLLDHLMRYTSYGEPDPKTGRTKNWLSDYAVKYRYEGAVYVTDQLEQMNQHEILQLTAEEIIARIEKLTGTTREDWLPPPAGNR